MEKVEKNATSVLPCALYGHSASVVSATEVWIVGGSGAQGGLPQWTLKENLTTEAEGEEDSNVTVGFAFRSFGGGTFHPITLPTAQLSAEQWSAPHFHSASVVRSREELGVEQQPVAMEFPAVLLFGGKGARGYSADCALLWRSAETDRWRLRKVLTAGGPDARFGHCAGWLPPHLYVWSGYDSFSMLAEDMWKLQIVSVTEEGVVGEWSKVVAKADDKQQQQQQVGEKSSQKWKPMGGKQKGKQELKKAEGSVPAARVHAAYTAHSGQLFVHGGRDENGDAVQDPSGAVWIFEGGSRERWRRIDATGLRSPRPRWGHSLVVGLGWQSALTLYGGRTKGGALQDAWTLDVERGEWQRLVSKATPRYYHASIVFRSRLCVLGGQDDAAVALSDCLVVEQAEYGECYWEWLTRDLKQTVLCWLDWKALLAIGCVNKELRAMVDEEWRWKRLLESIGWDDDLQQYPSPDAGYKLDMYTGKWAMDLSAVPANLGSPTYAGYAGPWKKKHEFVSRLSSSIPRCLFTKKGAVRPIKIITLGNGAVGKTCLWIRTACNHWPEEYIPTVFDNFAANAVYGNQNLSIGLWDTAGGEDYNRLRPLSYPGTDLFFICFSVVYQRSFNDVADKWLPEVRHHCKVNDAIRGAKILLVATKIDLRDNAETLEKLKSRGMKPVSREQGFAFAQREGIHYCETSAKYGWGVPQAMRLAVDIVLGNVDGQSQDSTNNTKCSLM